MALFTLKKYFIKTYGCQMNELDSEYLSGQLEKRGMALALSEDEADLIIFNTCSVRDLAERKILGKIGSFSKKKKKALIGIAGCMVSLNKEKLLQRFPQIDFVLGPHQIHRISEILDEVLDKKTRPSFTDFHPDFLLDYKDAQRKNSISAYVAIMRGCNNFCSYCVVPFTRGKEISRPFEDIINECKELAKKGFKEVTLLGQNVNSYGKDFQNKHFLFHDLLEKIQAIEGIERIRFLTSNPQDITCELIDAMKNFPKICEFLHFPLQSGSNRILKLMNRRYTKEQYLEKVSLLKQKIPNIKIGTDIIVGFPSETEEDFLETFTLFDQLKFSLAFIFAYSPRKNTFAEKNYPDDISKKIKDERLQKMLQLYSSLLQKEKHSLIGSTIDVLIEGFSKSRILKAKSRTLDKVVLQGPKEWIGQLKQVKIISYKNHTLFGEAQV